MNKDLIQKFLNKACWDQQAQIELEDWLNVEEFAELIVRECDRYARSTWEHGELLGRDLLIHFGVEE